MLWQFSCVTGVSCIKPPKVALICLISNFHFHLYLDNMVGYWFILVIGLYWLSEQHGYWSRKELQMMGWPLLLFYRKQNDRCRKGSKRTKMKRQIWNDERLRSVPSSFQHNTHLHILQHKTWDWYGRFWKSCWTLCYLPDSLSHTCTLHWWEVGDKDIYVTNHSFVDATTNNLPETIKASFKQGWTLHYILRQSCPNW